MYFYCTLMSDRIKVVELEEWSTHGHMEIIFDVWQSDLSWNWWPQQNKNSFAWPRINLGRDLWPLERRSMTSDLDAKTLTSRTPSRAPLMGGT